MKYTKILLIHLKCVFKEIESLELVTLEMMDFTANGDNEKTTKT